MSAGDIQFACLPGDTLTDLLALSQIFIQTQNLHHHSHHTDPQTQLGKIVTTRYQPVEPWTMKLSFSDDHEKKFREITELSNLPWQIVQILGLQISG